MASDETFNQTRRNLGAIVQAQHSSLAAIEKLLEHKATAAPGTAEAKAWKLARQSKAELEGWIVRSAKLLDEESNERRAKPAQTITDGLELGH